MSLEPRPETARANERPVGFPRLLGRVVAHLLPLALVAVMAEAWLAFSLYPALGDVLEESWLWLALRLWTTSLMFVLVLAAFTALVVVGLRRVVPRAWTTFLAGAVVAGGLSVALAPVIIRVIFPTTVPWDRSLLTVVVGLVVATPVVSAVFGLWTRFALSRQVGRGLAVAAAVIVLVAVPGTLSDIGIDRPTLAAGGAVRSSEEPAILDGDSVVLVTVDTLRASHMSVYGYGRDTTPGLQAWAQNATVFTHAITARTFTAPAVASLMSGVYPGLHGVGRHPSRFPDPIVTLAELFAEHGYRTAAFVTNPALARPTFNFDQGFSEWHAYPNEESRAETVLADAHAFLEQPSESPFFLWVHLLDPHSPYRPPPPYDRQFVDDQFYGTHRGIELLPASGGWGPREVSLGDALGDDWEELGLDDHTLRSADYLVAQYDGEIRYLDGQLSQFLRALRNRHPDALVVLTSDHGESLVEHEYFFTHGRFCYEPTARVPLMLAHPRLASGRVEEVVSLVDVLPTLVELVGLRSPLVLEGHSLSGFLGGDPAAGAAPPASMTQGRVVRLGARSTNTYPTLCLRNRRWKLVLTPRRSTQPLDLLLETQFRLAGTDLPSHFFRAYRPELYDLDADPKETSNVEGDESDTLSRLKNELWTMILQQEIHRAQLGAFYEPDVGVLDEDTLRELRALGYIR